MRSHSIKLVLVLLLFCLTVSGVSATWVFVDIPSAIQEDIPSSLGSFTYSTFYITKVNVTGGSYSSAEVKKVSDVNVNADISLNNNASSTVVMDVTFYNNSDVSYYYNEAQTVSSDNANIGYTVSGIEQKEEVAAGSFKTLTVTFAYSGNNRSNRDLLSEVHFNFVVDKDSIGVIAAQTAVTRFADILNNVASANSYQTLKTAMNNRGSNASTVSFVGNVSGASDNDSKLIQQLFTNEFLNMDLDGDGKSEPITLMIKREDLDGNIDTGDDYTYNSLFGINRTVQGAEMTIYITSEGFSSNTLTVYAASFTRLEGSDEWIQVVPLTKGTATANRYSFGFGGNNSFNTDTWLSDDKKTIEEYFEAGMRDLNNN